MSVYRLCFVDSIRTWGGAEVWFLETARQLHARGVGVDLVAQPDSELRRRADRAGVPCAPIAIRFDTAPWTLMKLVRHFHRRGTTAVVANLTKDLKASAVAGQLAGVRRVLGTRESDFPLKNKAYYRWYLNRLADGLLVNSEATRRTTLASAPWLDPDRVHLLYKGVDTRRFAPTPTAESRAHVVGFVGQLIERKGLQELMEAWSLIERIGRNPSPRLRIAGQGPLEGELRAWRDRLRSPERVDICGFVEDTTTFYAGCGLLAMPSHAEGFGLAAAEAGACGLPVVAGDASSLPEIVVDGETGLLVPPRNAEALAAAITALLDDPPRARSLGAAGHARITENFDREHTLQSLLRLTGGPELPPHRGEEP